MEETKPDRDLDPQKLLRIASLAREVLEEMRRTGPQGDGADNLAAVYRQVRKQLAAALPESLVEELDSIEIDMAFKDGATHDEVRLAYAALIGWLGGLFQGMQAATLQAHAMAELESRLGQDGQAASDKTKPLKEGYL